MSRTGTENPLPLRSAIFVRLPTGTPTLALPLRERSSSSKMSPLSRLRAPASALTAVTRPWLSQEAWVKGDSCPARAWSTALWIQVSRCPLATSSVSSGEMEESPHSEKIAPTPSRTARSITSGSLRSRFFLRAVLR